MSGHYKVVMNGEIIPGWEKQEVLENLGSVFKTDPQKTARLISGKPTEIKKGLNKDQAMKLQRLLENAGADCDVVGTGPAAVVSSPSPPSLPTAGVAGVAGVVAAPPTAPSPAGGMFRCPQCGQTQARGHECVKCGVIFDKLNEKPAGPAGAGSVPGAPKSTVQDDLYAFVSRNQRRYMHKFEGFREGGDSFSVTWNWTMFFLSFFWLSYRKLYYWAGIAFVSNIVSFTTNVYAHGTILQGLLYAVYFILHIALCLSANYLYYRHARANIRQIRAEDPTGDVQLRLSKAGGVSWAAVIGSIVLFILVVCAVAMPLFRSLNKTEVSGVVDEAAVLRPTFHTHDGGEYQGGSAFIIRFEEAADPYLLVMSSYWHSSEGVFSESYAWNEIDELVRKVSAKSITEPYLEVETMEILPIPGAKSVRESEGETINDLSVFPLYGIPGDIPVLTLADKQRLIKNQPVWLLAKAQDKENADKMLHRARIVGIDHTGMMYAFDDPQLYLAKTSGAPVLDADGNVIAIHLLSGVLGDKLIGYGNPAAEVRKRIEEALASGS